MNVSKITNGNMALCVNIHFIYNRQIFTYYTTKFEYMNNHNRKLKMRSYALELAGQKVAGPFK